MKTLNLNAWSINWIVLLEDQFRSPTESEWTYWGNPEEYPPGFVLDEWSPFLEENYDRCDPEGTYDYDGLLLNESRDRLLLVLRENFARYRELLLEHERERRGGLFVLVHSELAEQAISELSGLCVIAHDTEKNLLSPHCPPGSPSSCFGEETYSDLRQALDEGGVGSGGASDFVESREALREEGLEPLLELLSPGNFDLKPSGQLGVKFLQAGFSSSQIGKLFRKRREMIRSQKPWGGISQ